MEKNAIENLQNHDQATINEALKKAYEIIELSNIVVFEWTLSIETPIKFVTQNISQFGYSPEDFYHGHLKDYWDFVYEKDRQNAMNFVYTSRKNGEDALKHTYRIKTKEGHIRWVEEFLTIERDVFGKPISEKGLLRDITNEKQYENRLRYLSYHDALTGLYNRHYFLERLNHLAAQKAYPYSVIIGDLNGLKTVNDSFGHEMGDQLLIDTAKLLKKLSGNEGFVARLGGDEFGILLENTSHQGAKAFYERLKPQCAGREGKFYKISLSLGYATKTDCRLSNEELCKRADDMMYASKQKHRKSHKKIAVHQLQENIREKTLEPKNHAERLKKLVLKMGILLGLDKTELEDLRIAATMHDIGKIAIPNTLLAKPGPLTHEEWHVLKTHSEIGYHIILACTNIISIAEAVRHHHERFDGAGYPLGLSGVEIPVFSRIIAVADAFDAMTHYRPFAPRKSNQEAILEIKRCSGAQFDPMVVEAFLKATF